MRIKVGSLKGQPGASLQWKQSVGKELVEADLPVDVQITSPIVVDVVVNNTGNGLLMKGSVGCEVQFQCTRCLREFPGKLTGKLEEYYSLNPEDDTSAEEDDPFGEAVAVLFGDEIDLTAPIREALLLSIPMKILCSPDCPGLCPKCGRPRSGEGCGCEEPDVDLRMAPLMELLKKQEKRQERRKDNGSTKEENVKGKD